MFHYITSNKFRHRLEVHQLSQTQDASWLIQAAEWAEEKWGYIRNFPGVDERKKIISELKDQFYIVSYANKPIGMFALLDYHHKIDSKETKELMYFYVDESFRGLGIGSRVMGIVKDLCQQQKAKLIILETLNPNLNHFYEKNGAKVVCENHLLGHPTTVMMISS